MLERVQTITYRTKGGNARFQLPKKANIVNTCGHRYNYATKLTELTWLETCLSCQYARVCGKDGKGPWI